MTQRLDFYHLPKDQKLLTTRDHDLIRTLRTILQIEQSQTFTSDTLRLYGLDRFFPDKIHGIGGFFARLKANGKALDVGFTRSTFPSNHGRQIRKYRFADEGVDLG
jgi:hypothetical protein